MRCAIFQINADLVKVYEHINTFTQETLQLSFIWEILSKNIALFFPKPIGVLCHRGFWKHPRFTVCLLVLIVGELYNISNKNQLPNKSAKYLLFYTKDLTYLLHFQGKLALSIGELTATQENNSIIFAKSSILDSSILGVRMGFKDAFVYLTRF